MVTAKCLPVLYLLITLPTSTPIGPAPASRPAWTRAIRGASSFSVAASRSSRVRARSAASTGLRQATSRSPGKSGGDLGQVLIIEQAELQRPVVGHQLADGRGAGGDPPVGVRLLGPVLPLVQGADAGRGDHAAVADHDHLLQAEFLPDHVHDGGERGWVAGVAGEHPDRDRAAFGVGEQPTALDLRISLLAVPGVAAGGQRAARAFEPRGRQVEQRHPGRVGLRAEVAAGQPGLDRVLPVPEPVHRGSWEGSKSVDASATPRSAPRVTSFHQVKVDSLEPGRTTREMIRARARSARPARRS